MSYLVPAVWYRDQDLAVWRSFAVRSFPREAFGYLMGSKERGHWRIEEVLFHDDWLGDDTSLTIPAVWKYAADDREDEMGYSVIGTIHSHPFDDAEPGTPWDHSPSEVDWTKLGHLPIIAICPILRYPATKKVRSQVRFWHVDNPRGPMPERRAEY